MNSEYRIVSACEDDVKTLAMIENECIAEPWSENAFRSEMLKDNSIILKAVTKDGTICGFITADMLFDEVNIYNVAVSNSYRRQGIAKMLLCELERVTGNAGCYMLEVRESNEPAIKLYLAHGFETVGVRKNFYNAPRENAVLMTKMISM